MKASFNKTLLLSLVLFCIVKSVLISDEDDIQRKIVSKFFDGPKKQLFKVYHTTYQKQYNLESEEGLRRYRIFKENLKMIEESNAEGKTFKLAVGPFTDLTDEEFREKYLNNGLSMEEQFEITPEVGNVNTDNLDIDWTKHINTDMVKQDECGACWAFATITALEANYSLKYNKKLQLSVQDLIDCNRANKACDGGSRYDAYSFIIENGISYEKDYPFASGKSKKYYLCKSYFERVFPVESSTNVVFNGNRELTLRYLAQGPLAVGMDGNTFAKWQHYAGEMVETHNTEKCEGSNHAVVLAGVKIDPKDGRPYYIVKNSWGKEWGKNGFFFIKLRDEDKTCFLESSFSKPNVRDIRLPSPINPVYPKIYSECNFNGKSMELRDNLAQIPSDWSNKIMSLDLGNFEKVTLYPSEKCTASTSVEVAMSNVCYPIPITAKTYNYFPDGVGSIVIKQDTPPENCAWIYPQACYSGNKVEVCKDSSNLNVPVGSFLLGENVGSFDVESKNGRMLTLIKSQINCEVYGITEIKNITRFNLKK
jgi:C1A family cysteine protease